VLRRTYPITLAGHSSTTCSKRGRTCSRSRRCPWGCQYHGLVRSAGGSCQTAGEAAVAGTSRSQAEDFALPKGLPLFPEELGLTRLRLRPTRHVRLGFAKRVGRRARSTGRRGPMTAPSGDEAKIAGIPYQLPQPRIQGRLLCQSRFRPDRDGGREFCRPISRLGSSVKKIRILDALAKLALARDALASARSRSNRLRTPLTGIHRLVSY